MHGAQDQGVEAVEGQPARLRKVGLRECRLKSKVNVRSARIIFTEGHHRIFDIVHTDRNTDKWTHYESPKFGYRPTVAVPLSP